MPNVIIPEHPSQNPLSTPNPFKLIKVTCGFPAISDEVGRNSKSIMRMLSPDTDPGVKAFMAVVKPAERQSMKMV